jgi:hypothetical protein
LRAAQAKSKLDLISTNKLRDIEEVLVRGSWPETSLKEKLGDHI